MTLQIAFLGLLLVAMVTLFLTEKIPVDLTAFLGLIVLVFGGYVAPSEAFLGFSSPAVITMLSVFLVGAALFETGVADLVGARIYRWVGSSEVRLVAVVMLVCGVLSAFMNNTAATVVLMPAVASLAVRTGVPASRLFMPLAFGAILGGTTTMVGTPPNILAAQMLEERDLEPFGLFDFTPLGLSIFALGMLYMVTVGRKLLPAGDKRGPTVAADRGLSEVYQLDGRLFSLRIPPESPLDGATLGETRFGQALGIKVVAIVRNGRQQMVPDRGAELRAGDVLFVHGDATELAELWRLQGLEIESSGLSQLPSAVDEVGGLRARVGEESPLRGQSLRELRFRERFGLVVIGVLRDHELLRTRLAEQVLAPGDQIFALGHPEALRVASSQLDSDVVDDPLSLVEELQEQVFLLRIPAHSSLVGATIGESRFSERVGLTVAGVIRGGQTRLGVLPDERLEGGDCLLVVAEPTTLEPLLEIGNVQLEVGEGALGLESDEVGMVEAAVAPRSSVVGRSLADLDFRSRFGLLALALWREGQPIHRDVANITLGVGDALLLHGPHEKIRHLAAEPDFVVLSQADQAPRRTKKAPHAVACLILMIVLVAAGIQPIHVAAFTAGSLAVLFGALTMRQAYAAIEWRAIFLVAAVLPVGVAMERSGAASLLADYVIQLGRPLGNHATLAALLVLASLLSQGLDGAPTVVLLAPVVVKAADGLGISPYPLMMGVALAASAAFMTPFSHKANLLVMGAGGYRSRDYLRVGTPLTVVLLAVLVVLVPIFFPF